MNQINRQLFALSTAGHLRRCLLALVLCVAGFALLIPAFSASTAGLMPLDNQFPLTAVSIQQQLAHYSAASRLYYALFAGLDFVFPPLFSLGFALSWGWMLRRSQWRRGLALASYGLLLLPFTSAIADWLENITNLLLVFRNPPYPAGLLDWAITIKYAKLTLIGLNVLATTVIAVGCYHHRRHKQGIDPDQSTDK